MMWNRRPEAWESGIAYGNSFIGIAAFNQADTIYWIFYLNRSLFGLLKFHSGLIKKEGEGRLDNLAKPNAHLT